MGTLVTELIITYVSYIFYLPMDMCSLVHGEKAKDCVVGLKNLGKPIILIKVTSQGGKTRM